MLVRHVCEVCDLRVLRATRARAEDVCPRCGGTLTPPSLRPTQESESARAEQRFEHSLANGSYPMLSPAGRSYPFPKLLPPHLRETRSADRGGGRTPAPPR